MTSRIAALFLAKEGHLLVLVCFDRGLLTDKAAPVMNIIHSIFSLILKFRSQLISQSWTLDASKQMAVHPNFGLMQQSYNTFKYYSHFLFSGKLCSVEKVCLSIYQSIQHDPLVVISWLWGKDAVDTERDVVCLPFA